MNTDSHWSKQEVCFAHATQVWLAVNHNTLAAVNKIYDIHEAMNGCKNLKIH